ncbi:MAG: TVP38/TMEM64 family protein [Candidatus Delongbacteria bacterium]|nr:TVP38/TMEM64 family protein [Candidatus Cloacimonadota bacterium]MCA9786344.1 TVP38/TMEM64 family protein [Candidatus Cloacimonadota bacterium]MCB9472382.1 TVP38/TMEM64 family protein [Candidatus Delongbacteria bacterium]
MNKRSLLRVLAAIAVGLLLWRLPVTPALAAAVGWIQSLGALGWLLFILLYLLATVLLVPGVVLTLAAGFTWGLLGGTLLVSAGSVLGAGAAFLLGRHLVREWVLTQLASRPVFARIDRALGEKGFRIVLLTRLSPLFPFSLLNYACGLSAVSFRDYISASWIGMLPGTVLYVYAGTLLGGLGELAGGPAPDKSLPFRLLGWAGLAVTLLITVWITRIAQRALSQEGVAADAH